MKLNHLNLVVTDVENAARFFEKYFRFRCVETKGDNIVAVLKGPDDFVLVVMKSGDASISYPQAFHIGFMQSSMEGVCEIHTMLKNDGFDVGGEPKNIRDSFGFYFTFDGIMFEIGYYHSQI